MFSFTGVDAATKKVLQITRFYAVTALNGVCAIVRAGSPSLSLE